MADGEHKMLFDLRGRRKNVIRIIYALLALLMGGSLFLTVGPVNLGELLNTGSASSAEKVLDEQVERIEVRLAKKPTDEALLLALTRAQIAAGNAKREADPEGGTSVVTLATRKDYEAALESWNRYLKQAGNDPNPLAAQLLAGTFFSLAESGNDFAKIEADLQAAAKAQRIAARGRPNLGSLSTLAIFEYFNGNFAAGDRAAKEAVAKAPSKANAKQVEKQLKQNRKQAKAWDKQRREAAKLRREQGGGKEVLENPIGFGTP